MENHGMMMVPKAAAQKQLQVMRTHTMHGASRTRSALAGQKHLHLLWHLHLPSRLRLASHLHLYPLPTATCNRIVTFSSYS